MHYQTIDFADNYGGIGHLTAASVFLHDFAARFYAAALITFISHDAITTNSYPTNPFLYCNADPINYIDPTGKDAKVTFSGNAITITANVYICGDLASDRYVNVLQNNIESTWGKITEYESDSGTTYEVKWNVNVKLLKSENVLFNGINNYMKVMDVERSYVKTENYNVGVLRSAGVDGGTDDCPLAHELGHLLGLDDKYTTSGPMPGWNGNIMAEDVANNPIVEDSNMRILLEDFCSKYESMGNVAPAPVDFFINKKYIDQKQER